MSADIEYIQTETGMVPKDLTDTIKIREESLREAEQSQRLHSPSN